jgi:hypothetical protein
MSCAFVSCGDDKDPVDIDMANSVKYEKMSFRYKDVESGEMKYIYPSNREEFLAMRDIIIANKPTKETVSDSKYFMGSRLAVDIYFKEDVYAKTEMKKYEEFDLHINTYGYDKNSCGVNVDIESFNYEILEEISKNENLEKMEIHYVMECVCPT